MPGRMNTIIIVPHNKARFLKFSFSTKTLVMASCFVLTALILSVIAIAFTGNAVNRRLEVQRLKSENAELAKVNQQLEVTVSEVQGRLDEFEERTARLALAAGMESAGAGFASPAGSQIRVGSGGPYDRLPESPEVLTAQGRWVQAQLDLVEGRLSEQGKVLASTPTVAPVFGLITDGFGRRKDPFTGRLAFHRGLDISARRGTPIKAPADGIVVFSGRNGGLGKTVRISHDFGFTTVYGHLDRIDVEPGDVVSRGQEIGALGNTGRSTGPHLHYEVHEDGAAKNPLYFILDAF
ncbi:MAG: peptidoglycan DD-metalloendopeptidase family protein [Acidobacteria bacterium]|jgi:murein DD-endopeptidase MepM/ murein hydrolase activator NlpD|nr:peptidoglycan DD-metalloendopeptidase family protein [Acidobacteriota bacterium]